VTPFPRITPIASLAATPVVHVTPGTTPTPIATSTTPSPAGKIPGFEAIIAILVLLVVAYILRLKIVK